MYFKKRQVEQPGIELRTQDGRQIPMHITFLNGQIHINPAEMEKGAYQLVIDHGSSIEAKNFQVG